MSKARSGARSRPAISAAASSAAHRGPYGSPISAPARASAAQSNRCAGARCSSRRRISSRRRSPSSSSTASRGAWCCVRPTCRLRTSPRSPRRPRRRRSSPTMPITPRRDCASSRAARHLRPQRSSGVRARRPSGSCSPPARPAAPKMVVHASRHPGRAARARRANPVVWSTFYDIRRYGGLQILLRALLGGGSMVLSSAARVAGGFSRARRRPTRVTHISGTPSHWRRALMSPAARGNSRRAMCACRARSPIRRSWTSSARIYPQAPTIAHAFASTEAGVAFDVSDGQAGFPARS